MEDLQAALSSLLSLRSSSSQINASLALLNASLSAIALSDTDKWRGDDRYEPASGHKAAFVKSQDSFEHNVASRLLDFIARCLLRLQNIKYGDDYQAIFLQLGQAMKLVQGFLLLHPASRSLFAASCNMELLLTSMTLPDHSSSATPNILSESTSSVIAASPSLASLPFDFGASFAASTEPGQAPTLAELTLETLLCAVADSPGNAKLFEELGGVAEVVRVLRGKVDGGKAAKMKALEFLYFWLYPEIQRSSAVADARPSQPSTPLTPRKSSGPQTPRRAGHSRTDTADMRLRAMLETTHDGWSPTAPSKPSRTFEHTQLALSRSAASLSSSSPRSADARAQSRQRVNLESTQANGLKYQRTALAVSQSASRLSSSRPPSHRSPGAGRTSIMGRSIAACSPPSTPTRAEGPNRRSSNLRTVTQPDAIESYLFKAPRQPPSESLEGRRVSDASYIPASQSLAMGLIAEDHVNPTGPLSRSQLSPRKPRQVIAEDLPGSSGSIKGLFASPGRRASLSRSPHKPPAIGDREHPANGMSDSHGAGTRERRRHVLGKYLGNVDQLLERFDEMRCGS